MSQFYVTDTKSTRIAIEGARDRKPITISGMVGKGIRFFTGVVQSVEEDQLTVLKRWRVNILDGKQWRSSIGTTGVDGRNVPVACLNAC